MKNNNFFKNPTFLKAEIPQNFYWGVSFNDRTYLDWQQSLRNNRLFKFAIRLLAFGGMISFIAYFVTSFKIPGFWQFWNQKSLFLAIFYLSVWADAYLIFNFVNQALTANKIQPLLKKARQNLDENIEISSAFAPSVLELLNSAYLEATGDGNSQNQISILRFFLQIVQSRYFLNFGSRLNINSRTLQESLRRQIEVAPANEKNGNAKTPYDLEPELQTALITAFEESVLDSSVTEVSLEKVIGQLYNFSPLIKEVFFSMEVGEEEFQGCLDWLDINRLILQHQQNYHQTARFKITGDMNASYTASSTPILNNFSEDLTIIAQKENLPLCVGRQKEMSNILDVFSSGQNGVILVGPPQVGKKTLVDGLAQLMVEEKVPWQLKDKRLISLDITRLLGGADQILAQKRLIYLLRETINSGNIVLFIDEINNIIGTGTPVAQSGQVGFDFAKILADAVKSKEIFLIATCQDQIYERYVEKQPLGQVLMKVRVDEPEIPETIRILQTKTLALEEKNKVLFSYDCLSTAANLSQRYINEKRLPQKAIEVIKLATIKARERCSLDNDYDKNTLCVCGAEDAAAVISDLTQIPLQKVTSDESEKLISLETELHQYVIGQDEAVGAVANALRRARTNLQDGSRPLASFLFLGPTGVGKTELSKTIAKTYFGKVDDMIRLDMSEYQLPSDVIKMIGDPQGTLGYLTEAVRKKPYALILFDEIEKAHPDILNLFLQMLDDGRMTNGQGQTISFANTIIIATSNAGANYIHQAVGEHKPLDEIKQKLLNELLFQYFRPEFINRFDDVIVFTPLTTNEVAQIVALTIAKIQQNLIAKGIFLEIGEQAIRRLAEESYDPQYGARPMRRYIKDNLESQIALLILNGSLERRDKVMVNDDLSLKIEKAVAL